MSDRPLSPISAADAPRAYETLVSAFADDPVERWLLPDDTAYATGFTPFVSALGDTSLSGSTAWEISDFAAVIFWIPPGVEPDAERIGRVLIETVAPEKHADTFAILEQLDASHPPFPHWYLPWLGVVAHRQNRGLGGQLLAQSLEYVDLGGLPVYLETPNPRTVPFFERHGFAVTGHAQSGDCPPLTCMVREARGAQTN
jgi:GNAT superfamily N-acetyltransferase